MSNPAAARPTGYTLFEPPRAADIIPTAAPPRPSALLRLLERFALISLGLYHLPLAINNYPSLGGGGFGTGLAVRWGHVFTVPGIWVARHVLGVTGSMPGSTLGDNGDVAEEFGRLLICVVVGLVGAAVWSVADRRKPAAGWVPETLRVMLRYAIALGLISYGIGKIVPMQFPPIGAAQMQQRLGDMSPMQLLWTFMEYSRPYAFFAGVMECLVVALLCFRRTATAGALLGVAVMANVALLNWAYDVPVKMYSTMIVLSAAVLVMYDARRLIAVFVLNRSVSPDTRPSLFHARIPRAWRWGIKTCVIGSVAVSSLVAFLPLIRARADYVNHATGTPVHADTSYRLLRDRFHLMLR